jgi:2-polyprenyl-3-methyl-5-hydroxy-6-metoxy-1,4-benzoquinol methylase
MDTSRGEDLVRAGYDALSHHYRGDDDSAEEYGPWLADLQTQLPDHGDVLDIGCGCGLPVARCLASAGHRVTGVDISDVQIERARRLVPDATFIRADAAQLHFPPGSFDAIVCLYTLIHMPLDQQSRLLRSIAEWLRPGGWLLATTGQDAWTGTQDNWLGGPATMWWSHADAATYRSWLQQAGLEVTVQQFVPEGDSGHAIFWARRPPYPPQLTASGHVRPGVKPCLSMASAAGDNRPVSTIERPMPPLNADERTTLAGRQPPLDLRPHD